MKPISTFDLTKYPLIDLLKDIHTGRIQLPDFQRDWVWNDTQIRGLLQSISCAYPIGAVMMLQQNENIQFKPRLVDGVTTAKPQTPNLLILDGQQRLTTLYSVLMSQAAVTIADKKKQPQRRWYYLDIVKILDPNSDRSEAILSFPENKQLRTRHKTLDCSTPEQEYRSLLFPVSKIFSFCQWRSAYSRYWHYDPEKLAIQGPS